VSPDNERTTGNNNSAKDREGRRERREEPHGEGAGGPAARHGEYTSLIGLIEKAIRSSELGLNPGNDGKIIRVPIPQLTEERRKEFVKKLHHVAEDHRVGLRNIRRDANEQVKKLVKDKLISEDDDRRAHDEIQKMVDGYTQKLDAAVKAKEKDILEVK
jgi:ribosome recycling factor